MRALGTCAPSIAGGVANNQEKGGPVVEERAAWCEEQLEKKFVEPSSDLKKAINMYAQPLTELTR
jgi:hypothetical protein